MLVKESQFDPRGVTRTPLGRTHQAQRFFVSVRKKIGAALILSHVKVAQDTLTSLYLDNNILCPGPVLKYQWCYT